MSKKTNSKKNVPKKKHQESVFKEAWENMNEDMGRVMPDFLAKRLQDRKGKVWIMVAITFIELVVLGVIGKFVYDWFVS